LGTPISALACAYRRAYAGQSLPFHHERRLTEQDPGFISLVAMAETAWVLEHEQEVFTAMIALKEGRGSFARALIAALGDKAGCSRTLTFGRQALRLAGFEIL
jgi:predicted nucleic-acid-binding protein